MNNRRKLVIALGASALVAPLGSFAQQQGKVWRLGYLEFGSRQSSIDSGRYGALLDGLRERGYVEGKHFVPEARYADGHADRLDGLAAELVQMKVDVIVAGGNDAPLALQKATATIPIVMASASDVVGNGLIKSLARPGGNITGLSTISYELYPKRVEMLRSVVPKLSRVAVLLNPVSPAHFQNLELIQAVGGKSRITILPAQAQTPKEIDTAFSLISQQNAGAMIVMLSPFFRQQRSQIAELAAKYRLPAIAADRIYAEAGVLMSYGTNNRELYVRAATYIDKILKGAKPADLPVEQPTKFELIINGKTAKALGLTIPQSLLISADKVIE